MNAVINGRVVEVIQTERGVKYIDRPLSAMEERYEAWKAEQCKEKMLKRCIATWGDRKSVV